MKLLLIVLTLTVSSLAQAITLDHFILYRDGGGQFEAAVSESDEGLRIALKKCNFRAVPDGVEAAIRGMNTIAHTKLILKGKASILADESPYTRLGETGSWSRLSYAMDIHQLFRDVDPSIPVRLEIFEVRNPMILINGVASTVLEELELQAQALCK